MSDQPAVSRPAQIQSGLPSPEERLRGFVAAHERSHPKHGVMVNGSAAWSDKGGALLTIGDLRALVETLAPACMTPDRCVNQHKYSVGCPLAPQDNGAQSKPDVTAPARTPTGASADESTSP